MIGIYGGTFDPIHNGHIHVIKQLLSANRAERIIVVPSGSPRLRDEPTASAKDRLEMCSAAVSKLNESSEYAGRIEVSTLEVDRSGPSYAIDTVEALMKSHPGVEFGWIIGSDAYRKIDQWHESHRLQELVSFIVIERPDAVKENDDEFNLLDIDALEISATEIRARLLRGESVSQMVPAAVLAYIEEKGLYVSA